MLRWCKNIPRKINNSRWNVSASDRNHFVRTFISPLALSLSKLATLSMQNAKYPNCRSQAYDVSFFTLVRAIFASSSSSGSPGTLRLTNQVEDCDRFGFAWTNRIVSHGNAVHLQLCTLRSGTFLRPEKPLGREIVPGKSPHWHWNI